jgi:hypothetical protein
MERDPLIEKYVSLRDNFVQRIGKITGDLNAWTETHLNTAPTLKDIAIFEGLRGERTRLLAEFEDLEDRFVLEMLQRLSSEDSQPQEQKQRR